MSERNKQLVEHFINLSWNTGRFNLLRQMAQDWGNGPVRAAG